MVAVICYTHLLAGIEYKTILELIEVDVKRASRMGERALFD
jgi:hypothetical protein